MARRASTSAFAPLLSALGALLLSCAGPSPQTPVDPPPQPTQGSRVGEPPAPVASLALEVGPSPPPPVASCEDDFVPALATGAEVLVKDWAKLLGDVSKRLTEAKLVVDLKTQDPPPAGRVPSLGELREILKSEIAADRCVPYGYIRGDCFARAHVMVNKLAKHNINGAKLFVTAVRPNALWASNDYFPKGITWGFHVAALVVVNDNGALAVVVLDPSVTPAGHEPMPPDVWVRAVDSKAKPDGTNKIILEAASPGLFWPRAKPKGTYSAGVAVGPGDFATYLAKSKGLLASDSKTLTKLTPHPSPGVPGPTATLVAVRVASLDEAGVLFKESPAVYTVPAELRNKLSLAVQADRAVDVQVDAALGNVTSVE